MHGPPEMPMGRGMVLFACYGATMSDALDRWHRLLLVIGLVSGIAAFVCAVWMAGLFR